MIDHSNTAGTLGGAETGGVPASRTTSLTTGAHQSMSRRRLNREAIWGLLFILPAVVFFAVFYFYPIVWAGWISLHEYNMLNDPKWVGLDNYERLFRGTQLKESTKATFYYTFGTVIPIWIIAMGLALVFNNAFRLRRFFLSIVYLPAVISLTVWCLLFLLIYQPSYGLMTFVTKPLGFEYVRWLNDRDLAMPALILLSVLKGVPAYMIIYLAGLSAIPNEYYEAASLDGANFWSRFRDVTLPLLKPVLLYVAVISIIFGFQVFTPAYLLTNGGPGSVTRVLPLFIFENAFGHLRMGYASAASMVLFALLLGLTLIQFRLLGERSA
jgi:ABC-type sugar transport system permease subunit